MSDFTGETKDGTQGNIEELMRLFPQVVTEAKDGNGRLVRSVDFAALRELLGDDTSENDERYDFTWAGKKEAMREAARPTRKTLRPCKEESKNWDTTRNLYIEGDNLEALKILENTYHGQVKMIYIDPPYNTGHDFIYHDSFGRSQKDEDLLAGIVSEETGEQFAINPETNGRYHSDWCSMMYPRLVLARKLLKDDGTIFISIDDNEAENLLKLCDEVFGETNRLAILVWKKKYTGGKGSSTYADYHEYILSYAKCVSCLSEISMMRPDEEKDKFTQEDEYLESRGRYYTRPLKSNLDPRPTLVYPIELPNGHKVETQWICSKETFEALKRDGRIEFKDPTTSKWPVYKKFYELDAGGTTKIPSFLEVSNNNEAKEELKDLFGVAQTRDLPFETPKPTKLLRLFVENFSSRDDIVLDFFSGAASTADAVMQGNYAANSSCNRRFIMIQLPERCGDESPAKKLGFATVCEIGKERIRRAGEKILAEWMEKRKSKENELALDGDGAAGVRALAPDIGFRVFKVSDSNMEDVFYSPNDVTQTMLPGMVNNVKEGRTGLDVLISTRLEWGLSIDCPIDEETVDGKTVFSVDGGQMLACFETGITDAFVKKLAMRKPQFAIFRDVDFKDSAAKINAREIFKAVCGKDAPTEVRFL